jgi:hypothetical protein
MREYWNKPELPTLVSETCKIGNSFPYTDATEVESVVWYWAVLRFKRHGLDFYFDEASFTMATRKIATLKDILKEWAQVYAYVDYFLDQDGYTTQTKWDFNYLTSAHSINKYLGTDQTVEDLNWWREHAKQSTERERIDGVAKQKVVEDSRTADWNEHANEYAAKLGVDPEAIKRPFEN